MEKESVLSGEICEWIADEEIEKLTEEAFDIPQKHRGYRNMVAAIVLIICLGGIANRDFLYARANQLVSYVFGEGIKESDYFVDYDVLKEPVTFQGEDQEGEYTVETAYKKGNQVKIVIVTPEDIDSINDSGKLKVNGSSYSVSSTNGRSIYKNFWRNHEEVRFKVEYVIENIKEKFKEGEKVIFEINDQEVPLEFVKPATYNEANIHKLDLKNFEVYLIPLSEDNTYMGVDIVPKQKKLKRYKCYLQNPKLVDAMGLGYPINELSAYNNELKVYDIREAKIKTLMSGGIIYCIDQGEKEPYYEEIEIKIPKMNETIKVNQKVNIKGIHIVINDITLNKDGIFFNVSSGEKGGKIERLSIWPANFEPKEGNGFVYNVGGDSGHLMGDFSQYAGKKMKIKIGDVNMLVEDPINFHFE